MHWEYQQCVADWMSQSLSLPDGRNLPWPEMWQHFDELGSGGWELVVVTPVAAQDPAWRTKPDPVEAGLVAGSKSGIGDLHRSKCGAGRALFVFKRRVGGPSPKSTHLPTPHTHSGRMRSLTLACFCAVLGLAGGRPARPAAPSDGDAAPSGSRDAGTNRFIDVVKRMIENGKPPHEVADLVHDAVLTDQFWLFTDDVWDEPIARRHREIAERLAPTLPAPRRS